MTFFSSPHCRSCAHCRTCRALRAGRPWRRNIAETFSDVIGPDFSCPHNLPWHDYPLRPDYPTAVHTIIHAPDLPPWTALKQELLALDRYLRLHRGRRPSCWLRHQHRRLLTQYQAALPKALCTPSALPLQPH